MPDKTRTSGDEGHYTTGGYDEVFSTWSPDDKDFNIRLNRLGYQGREIEHRFLDAVSHNDKMRCAFPHSDRILGRM